MTNPSPWHRDPNHPLEYYLLVPNPTRTNVLLLAEGNSWTLPHFTPSQTDFRSVGAIHDYVRDQLGIETVVMRCVAQLHNPENKQWDRLYALDNSGSTLIPPNGILWADHDDLETIRMSHDAHRARINLWLHEIKHNMVQELSSPWRTPGWHLEAAQWIRDEIVRLHLTLNEPIRQERVWAISSLMVAQTNVGTLYFKAVPPFMAQETVAAVGLSQRYPDLVPPPVVADPQRGWLLMPEYKGISLTSSPSIHQWEQVLQRWAQVQVEQVDHIQHWLQMGIPDRRMHRMVALIDPLLTISTQTLAGRQHGLTASEVEGLLSLTMKLKLLCANLVNYQVPPTLVHGDLSGNIHVHENQYTIFDWTDICITHPFFEMATTIATVFDDSLIQQEVDVRSRLRNAFLEPWTCYAPMDRLIEAFEVSTSLGALHQAMSYMWILMNISEDARWELESGLLRWLRRLLQLLPPNV